MPRRPGFDVDTAVAAAQELFWRQGFDGTSLDHLEAATGLSRSSIYLAFGSKRGLFNRALKHYGATFVADMLKDLESDGAALSAIEGFFVSLATRLRGDLNGRGCLIVNQIFDVNDTRASESRAGAELHDRYEAGFRRALTNAFPQAASAVISRRARALAVCAMGVWVTAKADSASAAADCDAIAAEVLSWSS